MPRMAAALLFIFYCFEAGIFFTVVPWTRFWSANPLLNSSGFLLTLAQNGYFRGFISGLGIVHLLVGAREIVGLFQRGDKERP